MHTLHTYTHTYTHYNSYSATFQKKISIKWDSAAGARSTHCQNSHANTATETQTLQHAHCTATHCDTHCNTQAKCYWDAQHTHTLPTSWASHDSWLCVTWRICVCDMTHCYAWHDSFLPVTWLIPMCGMTYSHVWHDSFLCVTWRIPMCDMTHFYAFHDSFACVTWLIAMRDRTHSCVWRDSFPCVAWLIPMCDMTHSYVWHDSFLCVSWLICVCDMAHSYVWYISLVRAIFALLTRAAYVMSHTQISHVTHRNESCHTGNVTQGMSHTQMRNFFVLLTRAAHPAMGGLRLVGSLKVWVSFAEYRLFYRALLQKRFVILRDLLIVATPYC